jgi:hypothetical protein
LGGEAHRQRDERRNHTTEHDTIVGRGGPGVGYELRRQPRLQAIRTA